MLALPLLQKLRPTKGGFSFQPPEGRRLPPAVQSRGAQAGTASCPSDELRGHGGIRAGSGVLSVALNWGRPLGLTVPALETRETLRYLVRRNAAQVTAWEVLCHPEYSALILPSLDLTGWEDEVILKHREKRMSFAACCRQKPSWSARSGCSGRRTASLQVTQNCVEWLVCQGLVLPSRGVRCGAKSDLSLIIHWLVCCCNSVKAREPHKQRE